MSLFYVNVVTLMRRRQWHPTPVTLAWKIPWMEEPGRLQSMGSLRVGHDWVTSLWLFTFMHWRRKWQPDPVSLPGESQGWWSLMGCSHGVAQSRTRLKQLSSSSDSHDWATSLSRFTFMHWRGKLQPTPVFLPGESQGQGSLVSCHLWDHTESDTTEAT